MNLGNILDVANKRNVLKRDEGYIKSFTAPARELTLKRVTIIHR